MEFSNLRSMVFLLVINFVLDKGFQDSYDIFVVLLSPGPIEPLLSAFPYEDISETYKLDKLSVFVY